MKKPQQNPTAALARFLRQDHCFWTGRGASAIYVALRALDAASPKVVLPAVTCPAAVYPVILAGYEPIFCDILEANFTMDPEDLERVLADEGDVAAILMVHSFGHAADARRILDVARRRKVIVIEDACQSLGGTHAGRPLGAWGDLSVVSFGHTKQLDLGGGGAVLTSSPKLARRLRELVGLLPHAPRKSAQMEEEYRRCYYKLWDFGANPGRMRPLLGALGLCFRELWLSSPAPGLGERVARALPRLPELQRERLAKARVYRDEMGSKGVHLPALADDDCPWRFTFTLQRPRARATGDALRKQGFDVSHWYPALHRWFGAAPPKRVAALARAERFTDRVLNFWCDENTRVVDVKALSRAFRAVNA